MQEYSIGCTQATIDSQDTCVGVAKFTCQEWNEDGFRVGKNYSMEVRVSFDPATKRWNVIEMKEWEDRF